MTTTVESAFGSFHLVDGFVLNNQLTDFSADPLGTDGAPVANRVQPIKRPRSSMSPTLVFDRAADGARGDLTQVVGSPGGSVIIQFVLKSLIGVLDWGLDPQQAVSGVDFGAANTPETGVGGEHPAINASDNGSTPDQRPQRLAARWNKRLDRWRRPAPRRRRPRRHALITGVRVAVHPNSDTRFRWHRVPPSSA
jgi:gamma-glutamyltranspeptidase